MARDWSDFDRDGRHDSDAVVRELRTALACHESQVDQLSARVRELETEVCSLQVRIAIVESRVNDFGRRRGRVDRAVDDLLWIVSIVAGFLVGRFVVP